MACIVFDSYYRLIRIQPFLMTLVGATSGSTQVTVDAINSEVPQSGWLALAKTRALIGGTKNLSSGYDFESDPRSFLIISGDGIDYETVTLDQNCTNPDEIADLINSKLQQTSFATMVEAFVIDTNFIGLRQKDPQWGETFSFVLDYGSPDALTILGIQPGTHVGVSDVYHYSSWSGTTFYLDSSLEEDYPTGVYCAAYYESLTVQEIYNAAVEWASSPSGIVHPVPMEGSGYFPLGGGMYTDKIYVLKNGWKILPHQGNYTLTLIGTIITDDGSARVRLPRTGVVSVIFQVSSQGIVAYPMETEVQRIDQNVQSIRTDLDNPDQFKADVSGLAQESTVQEIKAKTDTIQWNDIKRILGLTQENFRLKNLTYDANKSLTSATIRVYANADDANNDQNPIAEYQISATYDSEGKCTSYLVTKV